MKNTFKTTLLATTVIAVMGWGAMTNWSFDTNVSNFSIAYADAQGGKGSGGKAGGRDSGHKGSDKGKGGHSVEDVFLSDDESEDSDRPDWAGTQGRDNKPGRGNTTPGISKGDLFGDMYALLRDENGVPILTPEGFVQPIDANGNPIPLDEEGHPIDSTLTIEVEIGRLNVGRAPSSVLSTRLKEVITNLNNAESVTLDPAGRIVYVIDGVAKTIDSPLENLAVYVTLMNTGTLGLDISADILGDLAHINDGTFTLADVTTASSLLAAATDKTVPMSIDQIVYVNSMIGLDGTIDGMDGISYIDYSTFSYDRSDVYENVMAEVLIKVGDDWVAQTVNIYDVVFGTQDYVSSSGIDGFTQAADDARAVINYIHEYEIPADSTQ